MILKNTTIKQNTEHIVKGKLGGHLSCEELSNSRKKIQTFNVKWHST